MPYKIQIHRLGNSFKNMICIIKYYLIHIDRVQNRYYCDDIFEDSLQWSILRGNISNHQYHFYIQIRKLMLHRRIYASKDAVQVINWESTECTLESVNDTIVWNIPMSSLQAHSPSPVAGNRKACSLRYLSH